MTDFFKRALILLMISMTFAAGAQDKFPKKDFIPPVDFPLVLSGTFGELRTNHFHSGIDIKTQGVQGKPVHAVADGYVSRIKISPGGFGKAVYIDHPDGYTTVYAHCRNFNSDIDKWVKAQQYKLESFEVNLFPGKDQFPVKQGDIIAWSGNTGSSMGPHLHFEIRETNGQIPVNPLLFGFPVKDYIRPKITRLMIYPYGEHSLVKGKNRPLELLLSGWGPVYRLKGCDTVAVSGDIYFGIETFDLLNAAKNKNGVYSITLMIDSVKVFAYELNKIPFTESKYVNSLIDYAYFSKYKKRIQKTYIEPGNHLSVYEQVAGHGIFDMTDNKTHRVQYIVEDAYENESVLTFYLKSSTPEPGKIFENGDPSPGETVFGYDKDNTFEDGNLRLFVPKGALYDTLSFRFAMEASDKSLDSVMYVVHNKSKPLNKACKLMIKPGKAIDQYDRYSDKYLIAKVNDKSGELIATGGRWEDDHLTAYISSFGKYVIAIDTVKPEIRPYNFTSGKSVGKQKTVKVRIEDDFSGIKQFRGTLNGKWILMEWDPKRKMLTYTKDDRMIKGKNLFKLVVTDNRNNEAVYETVLWN